MLLYAKKDAVVLYVNAACGAQRAAGCGNEQWRVFKFFIYNECCWQCTEHTTVHTYYNIVTQNSIFSIISFYLFTY